MRKLFLLSILFISCSNPVINSTNYQEIKDRQDMIKSMSWAYSIGYGSGIIKGIELDRRGDLNLKDVADGLTIDSLKYFKQIEQINIKTK